MLRLVLDTNVWLDWLVFDDPAVAPVKAAVAEGAAAVFIDDAVEAELARVLAYPLGARSLDAQARAAALEQCRGIARKDGGGRMQDDPAALPKCDDPDDQKFLELALACGAAFLLTRDEALLQLGRRKAQPLAFRIVTPTQFVADAPWDGPTSQAAR